jgi:hypothetical protein
MIFPLYAACQQRARPRDKRASASRGAPAPPLARQAHGGWVGADGFVLTPDRTERIHKVCIARRGRTPRRARIRMPRMPGAFAARATAGGVRRGSAGWRWSVSVPPASVRRSLHEAAAACPLASPVGQGHGRFRTRRQGPGPVRCGRRAREGRLSRQRGQAPPRERRPSNANQGESSCVGM